MTDTPAAAAIITVTAENAQQTLIDESFQRPVLADFWADWCAPCKQLMPVLEKLANEYAGAFLLAKINADEQGMIAQQLGVRSLPTVMLIKDGQPVDGFAGAQTEKFIREMLGKYLPKPWDRQLEQAKTLLAGQQYSEAASLLRDAWRDSGQQSDIGLYLAQCCLAQNRLDEAGQILAGIPMADQNHHYQQLVAELELQQTAAKTPELVALIEQLEQQPDNLQLKMQLAVKYWQDSHAADALETLLQILKTDRNFADGQARKLMLDIFSSLGNKDPLVATYQRQLFSLLY
ncbi:MAG TPA: thioredoxin [Pseudomonadales bacterium]